MKPRHVVALVIYTVVLLAMLAVAADQRIQYTEQMVGANHPTFADTLNRLTLVEHNTDGTHKAIHMTGDLTGDNNSRAIGFPRWWQTPITVTTDDNTFVFIPPYAVTIDSVEALIIDNVPKMTGASTDNAAFQLKKCGPYNSSTPYCGNVFTAAKVATGAASASWTPDNASVSATEALIVTFDGTNNMTGKALFLRIKYHE